jgi:hypothetical protein
MKGLMRFRGKALREGLLRDLAAGASLLAALGSPVLAGAAVTAQGIDATGLARALSSLRPDCGLYIDTLRPLAPGVGRNIYMALVQPGATNPGRRSSAPLAGPGARNDIVFDERAIGGGHSDAFILLLLDHEYFHARHLARTTTVPPAGRVPIEIERRFSEAAAWGFNVAEARAGRYPGLRLDELREALDRYRDHYLALRNLVERDDPGRWSALDLALQRPDLVTTRDSAPSEDRSRPSGRGRSTGTP